MNHSAKRGGFKQGLISCFAKTERKLLPFLLLLLLLLNAAGCTSGEKPQSTDPASVASLQSDVSSGASLPENSGESPSSREETPESEPEPSEESSEAPDPYGFIPVGIFRVPDDESNEAELSRTEDTLYFRLIGCATNSLRYVSECIEIPLDSIREGEPVAFSTEYDTIVLEFEGPDALNLTIADEPDDWRNARYVREEPAELSYPRPKAVRDPNTPNGAIDAGLAESARDALGMKADAVLTAEDCAAVTRLDVYPRQNPVASIDGIEYFVNLQKVSFTDCCIEDFSALGSLRELEELGIYNGIIETLPDLSGCSKLRSITVSCVPLRDLEALASLPALERAILINTVIRSVAPLKENHTLKSFTIDSCCVADWESIAENEDLKAALGYDYEECLEIEERAKEILRETVTDDMSDLEKQIRIAKYVEDFLNYDYGYEDPQKAHSLIYYGIINNRGICHNYADTAKYLMSLAGLEVRNCSSSSHEWNMILLDGKWYEFDCTWDDGESEENFVWFNRSRAHMLETDDHDLFLPEMYPLAKEDMLFAQYADLLD